MLRRFSESKMRACQAEEHKENEEPACEQRLKSTKAVVANSRQAVNNTVANNHPHTMATAFDMSDELRGVLVSTTTQS
jgi:hypothetical protein